MHDLERLETGATFTRHRELLLGAVLLSTAVGYALDSRLVLSLALTAFAGWLGVDASLGDLWSPGRARAAVRRADPRVRRRASGRSRGLDRPARLPPGTRDLRALRCRLCNARLHLARVDAARRLLARSAVLPLTWELRGVTGLALEWRLIPWGGAGMGIAIGLERALRSTRNGLTSRDPGKSGAVLELAQLGSFAGGGASGRY